MYQIHFKLDGCEYQFKADDSRPLLQVLKSSGLPLLHPCRNGVCGLCRCRLTEGRVTYLHREPHGLWQRDIEAGYILPCIAVAESDLQLDEITLDQS